MDFLSKLFRRPSSCHSCGQPLAHRDNSGRCNKCKNYFCSQCLLSIKHKQVFFTSIVRICNPCSHDEIHSSDQDSPNTSKSKELKHAKAEDEREIKFMSPNKKEMQLRGKSVEDEEIPAIFDISSSKQFLQEVKNRVKPIKQDPLEIYEIKSRLGEGASGIVYLCVNKGTEKDVVLKRYKLDNPEDKDRVLQEIFMMIAADHPNIVKFIECYEDNGEIWAVLEAMKCNLTNLIKDKWGMMTERQMAYICKEILLALRWLHKQNRIHRDIKSDNILLSINGEIKLSDFGVCAQITNESYDMTIAGTPCWMAPELISSSYYDQKVDIWSLGIVLFELVEGNPPYFNQPQTEILQSIANNPPPKLTHPTKWSSSFKDFIRICLQKNPGERASADTLLRHPFLERVGTFARDDFKDFIDEWLNMN
ncbi:unnamed protein product [Blepharisma stoltei]|uniref:Protein kinase domain-containing protein n=1 Tax=Blepharisma stoltei TaxID=1481888 RepID=A0AAU9I4H6_9CILI|nr:unnamed protein product [Blepharisma stoltei]